MTVPQELLEMSGGQTDLFQFYDELTIEEKQQFEKQIKALRIVEAKQRFHESASVYHPDHENLQPIPNDHHAIVNNLSKEKLEEYKHKGLEAIANGQVAAFVMAGGQASRLGSSSPKGTIPLGLNVSPQDSLLGIQAAKIAVLENIAKKQFPGKNGKIQWIVMTSQTTEQPTRLHLEKIIPEAGLSMDQLTMFSQSEVPAFDMNGNLFLADKNRIVTSPNGNGGLYSALAPLLPELRERGVRYFHVYTVDNILCKVADPAFIGYAIDKEADVVTKTIPKSAGELIGSVCIDKGSPRIVEYSELGPELAEKKTVDGRFLFGAGSIANHLYTLEFLERFCTPTFYLPYHRAHKKIPHLNKEGHLVKPDSPNGIKLEQFVFDVFYMSKNFHIWEVDRVQEFSPLKNAESAGVDCLSTCKQALGEQGARWLKEAGSIVKSDKFFLKSILSYDGENLEKYKGVEINDDLIQ